MADWISRLTEGGQRRLVIRGIGAVYVDVAGGRLRCRNLTVRRRVERLDPGQRRMNERLLDDVYGPRAWSWCDERGCPLPWVIRSANAP